jgi:hypothetical protein
LARRVAHLAGVNSVTFHYEGEIQRAPGTEALLPSAGSLVSFMVIVLDCNSVAPLVVVNLGVARGEVACWQGVPLLACSHILEFTGSQRVFLGVKPC